MRSRSLLTAAAVLAALGCSGDDGPTNPGDTGDDTSPTVTVSDNVFTPSTLSVPVNGTVTWQWSAAAEHNVTFDDVPPSPTQIAGSFARSFAAAGTYPYRCTIHVAQGMTGTITVTAGTGGTGGGGGGDTGGGGGYP